MQNYEAVMLLRGWEDAIICRAFPLTLTENASIWFNNLKEGSISNFNQLRKEFIDAFLNNARRKKVASYLLTIKQEEKKSLKDYVERFRAAILEVQDLQATVAVSKMLQGTRSRDFQKSLSLDQPLTLGDLFNRDNKFILSEDVIRHINAENRDKKRKDRDDTNDEGRKIGRENEHRQVPKLKFEHFTPLSQPHSAILVSIEGFGLLTFPTKANKTMSKFTDACCRFHKTHGHLTDRCRELMNEIESLVSQGKLNRFVYSETWRNKKPSYSKKERYEDNKVMNDKKDSKMRGKTPTLDNKPSYPAIHVIIGGETLAEETSSSRKAYAMKAMKLITS
ncbi:Retrovirus capsid C-terminal protein [Dioscorea alata]|uniref:Retrovirus capsid C-terminal protein n=1 Tax=Dioscorea alata TaxID=55571 RepID=A0ACB7UKX8_DIOAL|nr:Retrovirus capsid C-terminal protein [Dioscorea alata]